MKKTYSVTARKDGRVELTRLMKTYTDHKYLTNLPRHEAKLLIRGHPTIDNGLISIYRDQTTILTGLEVKHSEFTNFGVHATGRVFYTPSKARKAYTVLVTDNYITVS